MITKEQVLKAIELTLDEISWIDFHADDLTLDNKDIDMIGSSPNLTADVLTRHLNSVISDGR